MTDYFILWCILTGAMTGWAILAYIKDERKY